MISLKNTTKTYGSGKNAVEALKGVTIDFPEKGLVVILGKSGCGKTTLLNIMAGLDRPTSGEVMACGKSLKSFSSSELDSYRNTYVGMVFQEFNLIEEITVYQNIEITLKLQRRNADINTVDDALSMVGLASLGYRRPSELSGGQRQRVALARALLKKPQILLADEPTGALDVSTSEEVFESLKKLARDRLVVVVTHDRELAFTFGERIIELVDGRIVSDREIEPEAYVPVKSISENVIEVAAGGSISPQHINGKLREGSFNYVGISHDRDRIALAYPETFDSFYLPKEKIKMRDTRQEGVVQGSRPLALQKGSIMLRDAISMARVNRRRNKKRFRFITFLNTLCFACLSLSFLIAVMNLPDVIAKSAFDEHSQKVVAVSKITSNSPWQTPKQLSDEDISAIGEIAAGKKLHKVYRKALYPYFAANSSLTNSGSLASQYMSATSYMDIGMTYFSGVVEGEDIKELGLSMIEGGGTGSLQDFDEIIISDFAAEKLVSKGFFGIDKDGAYGCIFPNNVQELVGMKVYFHKLNRYFKIAGIFDTDYEKYKYLTKTEERVAADSRYEIQNWQYNKDFLYTKIFAKSGFVGHYNLEDIYVSFYVRGNNFGSGIKNLTYEKAYFKDRIDQTKDPFIWVSKLSSEYYDSEGYPRLTHYYGRGNRGIAVSEQYLMEVLGLTDSEELYTTIAGEKELKPEYSYLFINILGRFSDNISILAVYDETNLRQPVRRMVISDDLINILKENGDGDMASLDSVMFKRGEDFGAIRSLADRLYQEKFLLFSSVGNLSELLEFGDFFGGSAEIFLYISLGIAALSFLLILNYMASSVRFRAKEIAVYRVLGARRVDIARIFLTEGMMMSVVSSAFACALGALLTSLLRDIARATLQVFNLSFSIFTFNIQAVAVVFLSCALFVTVASLLPIYAATRRKAIDALKIIG